MCHDGRASRGCERLAARVGDAKPNPRPSVTMNSPRPADDRASSNGQYRSPSATAGSPAFWLNRWAFVARPAGPRIIRVDVCGVVVDEQLRVDEPQPLAVADQPGDRGPWAGPREHHQFLGAAAECACERASQKDTGKEEALGHGGGASRWVRRERRYHRLWGAESQRLRAGASQSRERRVTMAACGPAGASGRIVSPGCSA